MGRKEENIARVQALMSDLKHVRNIGTAAHIDHGKTTLSDSLLSGAGLISEELAGSQLALDYDEQEQARGITINAVNASMVHNFEGTQYLVKRIATPGPVDFSGAVTRARSEPVSTAAMPGWRRAASASMRTIRAWACGLRTNAACSRPGTVRSPT